MDRLDAMSILLTAVEAGSLSGAARRLGTPLATVSRKVSDLETHLGTRLFIRSNRRMTLTETGRSYVAACKRILDDLEAAERAAAGENSAAKGDLVITAPVVFGRWHVLPIVTEFLNAYPDIDIRLFLADRIVHLVDDHVDVALRIGELPDSSLIAIKVGDIRRVVAASPEYLAAHGTPRTPAALTGHRCITFEGLMAPDVWIFNDARSTFPVTIRSRLVVNTAEAAIDAAITGLGLTRVLSYQAVPARTSGHLVTVLDDFEPPPVPISLVYNGQGLLPLKLRAFLDFAVPRLKARTIDLRE